MHGSKKMKIEFYRREMKDLESNLRSLSQMANKAWSSNIDQFDQMHEDSNNE